MRELAERVLDGHLCPRAWSTGYSASRWVTRCSRSACSTPSSTPVSTSRHLGSRLSRRRCLPGLLNGCRRWTCTAWPCWSCWSSSGDRSTWKSCAGFARRTRPRRYLKHGEACGGRLVVMRDADGDAVYEVSHPLVQECIYAGLDSARRRALHHRVAVALTASNRLGEAARHHARTRVRAMWRLSLSWSGRSVSRGHARPMRRPSSSLARSSTFCRQATAAGSMCWTQCLRMQVGRPRTTGSRSTSVPASPRSPRLSGCCWQQRVVDATVDSSAQERLALVSSYLAGLLGWCLGAVDDAATRAERAADLYERAGDHARARAARCDLAWFEGLARRYGAQEALTRQYSPRPKPRTTTRPRWSRSLASLLRPRYAATSTAHGRRRGALLRLRRLLGSRVEWRSAWRSRRRISR